MRYMRLSAQTQAAIRAKAIGNEFNASSAHVNSDGTYDVPLSVDVIARINELRMKGETFDDATYRVITQTGSKTN